MSVYAAILTDSPYMLFCIKRNNSAKTWCVLRDEQVYVWSGRRQQRLTLDRQAEAVRSKPCALLSLRGRKTEVKLWSAHTGGEPHSRHLLHHGVIFCVL